VKKKQSLRIRFIILFTVFIIALCGVTTFWAIHNTNEISSQIFGDQGRRVVEKAVSFVDGDKFEALVKSMDENDPFYIETCRELLNLKEYSSCVYLYTMAPKEGSEWYFIIDGSAPPDDEENFSPLGSTDDVSEYDDAFFHTWDTGELTTGQVTLQEGWGWLVSIYGPIKNSAGVSVGIVGIDFEAEYLMKKIRQEAVKQIIMGVVSVAVGLALLLVFLRMIFTRLNNINVILKDISEGEGDLTRRIKILRNDEIGQLAMYFNATLDKIKGMVLGIKGQTVNLYNVGNELSTNMEKTATAIRQIAATIGSLKGRVGEQNESINQTGAAMEHVSVNVDKLNAQVTSQTESVSRSSSAIEEMLANLNSVTETLVKNAENVSQLNGASESGRTGLEGVSASIQEIAKESEGLLQINQVMQTIASQTNLLAMNAAIEAAHAGEAGRGFAVVADEIRKLAENSGKQSKIISTTLKKIKESIDGITASAGAVLGQFQTIDEKVRIVSQQEANIRAAMEEQGEGSKEILESVEKLNDITQQVKQGSEEMLTESKKVIAEGAKLMQASEEISGGMSEMAEGAEQINLAVTKVNEISLTNKEHINELVAEVSKFKVDG
jgi:methyl-accepting chemotaxis protein